MAREATQLLEDVGLRGHSHAIDAVVAVTALHRPPMVMLTSYVDDMGGSADTRVRLVAV